MSKYEKLAVEVIRLDMDDIILTSGGEQGEGPEMPIGGN